MITRSFGKILRGKATPFQLGMACILGTLLGFMPGFQQAPGLIVTLLLLLIVFNANLALAAMVGLGAKLLALLIAPLTFALGRFLLDGPLSGLFQAMINAPVLALFGFEYYLATGGLLTGFILGSLVAFLVTKTITAYRVKMAELEQGSEKFQSFTANKWVKLLTFILVGGGKGKKTYQEILATKVGNPIRPLGVVFAMVLITLLVLVQMFAAGPIITAALQQGLERANGATTELESGELNLKENKLILTQLAMADPNNLGTDLFRAAKLEANISGVSLLRKRLQLDRVQVTDASHGEPRATPGKLVGRPPEPTPDGQGPGKLKTIDDYIRDAKAWKERLAQVRRWLEKLSGPQSDQPSEADEETLQERLEREIRELGYARVRASHLIEGAPTFAIIELVAQKVRVAHLEGETLDITGHNLSTHPNLLDQAPELIITSSKDRLGFSTRLGQFDPTPSTNVLDFHYRGLPTDEVAQSLKVAGQSPVQGGTIDLAGRGQWNTRRGVSVDLPLQITLHDTTVTGPGFQPTQIDHLTLPVAVRGPIDNPRIVVDDKNLANALVQAGVSRAKDALTDKARETIDQQISNKIPGRTGDLIQGLFSGKNKQKNP